MAQDWKTSCCMERRGYESASQFLLDDGLLTVGTVIWSVVVSTFNPPEISYVLRQANVAIVYGIFHCHVIIETTNQLMLSLPPEIPLHCHDVPHQNGHVSP